MKTPMEALLGTTSDNLKLQIFGFADYVYVQKRNEASKFVVRASEGIYLGNEHGLHRILLPRTETATITKHASFDENAFPLSQQVERQKMRKIYNELAAERQLLTVDESRQSYKTVKVGQMIVAILKLVMANPTKRISPFECSKKQQRWRRASSHSAIVNHHNGPG